MNKIFKAVAGIFLCGMLLVGGRASAESDMDIFIETLGNTAQTGDRIFNQDIFFIVPSMFSEVDLIGGIENGKIRLAGNFGLWMTDNNGVSTSHEIPFYLVQTSDAVTLYAETDKKWKKATMKVPADKISQIFVADTYADLEQQINRVKEVTVLRESDNQRTLLVKLDGNKIADEFLNEVRAEMQKDPMASKIFGYIETGIRNADVWYTWTVNKNTWQTVTLSANLSGLIQSIAQTALNDPEQPIPAPFIEMLEPFAYYSEFRIYTTYLSDEAKSRLEIPKKVLKAKEVESFSDTGDKKKKK